jgi:endonuclease/exonuclease/phosphatase family metal-dependent hydrolase
MQQLADAACPEVVAVQEANADIVAQFQNHLEACGYQLVWDGVEAPDREFVLTRLAPLDSQRIPLAGGVRDALAVRFDSDLGAIDLITTHLASVRDNGPCDPTSCPPPCDPAVQLRDCQAHQLLAAVDQVSTGEIVVVAGDFNTTPDEPIHQLFLDAGFVDSHLAAGGPECAPDMPTSCTAGRDDRSMTDLSNPDSKQDVRIDYLFVAPLRERCEIGEGTGPFNAEPAPGAIAYPSDHTGVILDVTCAPGDSAAP